MATDKFLNLEGLTEVASYVNKKLRIVTEMPTTPTLDDIILYNGATTANYKQGSIYLYTIVETYYKWSDLSDEYYTKAAVPTIGDTVYSDTIGTDSGYTIEAYDEINNQVTINNLVYDRDATGDTPVNGWVAKSNTSVILNGEDKTGNEANFYAPTVAGTEGNVLISNGENAAPSWTSFAGYSPIVVGEELCFIYGLIPEVENASLIFDLDG